MVELIKVTEDEKQILNNLMEKYLYEFSQWELTDIGEDGLYGYEYLDCYFTEKNRFPYFIKSDGKLAGFVLVSDYPEVEGEKTDFCLSEFFILYKYRRSGVGREAVRQLLDRHHGKWQLKRHPHNTASVFFRDNTNSKPFYRQGRQIEFCQSRKATAGGLAARQRSLTQSDKIIAVVSVYRLV